MEENSPLIRNSIWKEVYQPYMKELLGDFKENSWILVVLLEIVLIVFGFGVGVIPVIVGIWLGMIYSTYKLIYIPIKERWLEYFIYYRTLFLISYILLFYNYFNSADEIFYGDIIVRSISWAIGLMIPYFLLRFIPKSLHNRTTENIMDKYGVSETKALVFDLSHIKRYEKAIDPEFKDPNKQILFGDRLSEKKNLLNKLLKMNMISEDEEITLWRSSGGFHPRYYLVIPVKQHQDKISPLLRRGSPSINIHSEGQYLAGEEKYRRDLKKIGLFWDETVLPPTEFIDKIIQLRKDILSKRKINLKAS